MLEQSFMRLVQEVLPTYRQALDNVIATQKDLSMRVDSVAAMYKDPTEWVNSITASHKDLIERIESLKLRVQTLEQAAPAEKPVRRRRKKVEPEPAVESEVPQEQDDIPEPEPTVEMAEDVVIIDGCALTPKLVSIIYNVVRSDLIEEDHAQFLMQNYGIPTAATAWVCDQTRADLINMGLLSTEEPA